MSTFPAIRRYSFFNKSEQLFFPQLSSVGGAFGKWKCSTPRAPRPLLSRTTAIPPRRGAGLPGTVQTRALFPPGLGMCTCVGSLGKSEIPCRRAQTEVVGKSSLYNASPLGVCFFNGKIQFLFPAQVCMHGLISASYNHGRQASPGKWGQQVLRAQLGPQAGCSDDSLFSE